MMINPTGSGLDRVARLMPAVNFGDPRLLERFWDKIAPCPVSGCWIWMAIATKGGYGRFTLKQRKYLAHCLAYQALIAAVPDGLELDHRCRVTFCCNPLHMEPVTHRVNVMRGTSDIARRALSSTCKYGHLLVGDNLETYERKPGRFMRRCRACRVGPDRKTYK